MKNKPIIVVHGQPNSIFLEIFLKSLTYKKFKSPIILIASTKLLSFEMIRTNINFKINQIDINNLKNLKLLKSKINLINVDFNKSKNKRNNIILSNNYISRSFDIALFLINKKLSNKLINGPISKKDFLNKKFLGITEYLVKKTKTKNYAMLIYNDKISVSPITTHLPLKFVSKNINKETIINKVKLINNFYKKKLKINPKIAVTGINPHCESVDNFNEDEKIILPSIKYLKKEGINISGPYSADTLFTPDNRYKFNIIIGMYHDQVLTPIKTLFGFNAINITLGLPFIRISPDHGPNEKMIGKNSSNPLSLIKSLEFLDK